MYSMYTHFSAFKDIGNYPHNPRYRKLVTDIDQKYKFKKYSKHIDCNVRILKSF